MREILYRGKRVDNGEWVQGFYCKCVKAIGMETLTAIQQTDDNSLYFREVIPETVGEYTGLCDKNGNKIFEGDILKGAWGTICQVVYDDCYLGFRAKGKDGMHICMDYYGLDRIEVIGNIHDNPELLKGE